MIVSDSHAFIYARVPKTASTSVSSALVPYRRGADSAVMGKIGRRLGIERRHHRFVDFRAHSHWGLQAAREMLPPTFFDRALKFTVVRHPFERMVSMYNHLLRAKPGTPTRRKFPELFEGAADLDSFIRSFEQASLPPQACLVIDYDGCPLIDAVARVERMEAEIAPIFEHLGAGVAIPRLNVGTYSSARSLSAESRAILRKVHAVDFELFGYDEWGLAGEPILQASDRTRAAGRLLLHQSAAAFTPWERVRPD